MCGGTEVLSASDPPDTGLSPRVRGNHHEIDGFPRQRGSIPACAGEPIVPLDAGSGLWVYPRVCGGTVVASSKYMVTSGLSPRVRGNQVTLGGETMTKRSIPACAGEPQRVWARMGVHEVYPRVCGGTLMAPVTARPIEGLSPRVRGNLNGPCHSAPHRRSIPACAGEPCACRARRCRVTVYPRVCGGTEPEPNAERSPMGLSPRVRGNPPENMIVLFPLGSIPACAGEPSRRPTRVQIPKVYPRVCGGTQCRNAVGVVGDGLSPRVRGNLVRAAYAAATPGSIPACAGEPASPQDLLCLVRGLSPRVRGNLVSKPKIVLIIRSIPACAGEP